MILKIHFILHKLNFNGLTNYTVGHIHLFSSKLIKYLRNYLLKPQAHFVPDFIQSPKTH